ncbi:patatin-like phospholipase domain-containing protein 5 isoform X3 [Canis lupus familiaris]|uniref:patatin-like phospholipase domain-containing protein 5 isoform X3 n=1 Tax=Canis lupus familiaris TaxID=9615 RepID=UPI000DC66AA0|nr:patatin-like phospholipase domain-containing protein 5 isoform X3 [Canis lupus familiaris]XP_025312870.1 patatin-like phospholipase domain-containing protein 5 isoform X3 [Canis lupus dingo]
MRCYEDEGSWNLSFSGAGFLGLYHVGVTRCFRERVPRLLQGARRIYGSSSGALNAVSIIADQSLDFCCSNLLGMVKHLEQLSLGIFHPAFAPIEHIRQQLQESLPPNIHILASQRLGISMTRWSDGRNIIVTNFATRNEVIQALICTVYFPFYCGIIPPEFRGEVAADNCRQGYLDALRFLERRGLTKEPVLWMLVSKEPPAPADGSQDTGHNRGQEGGLSLNWAVPNVLVKDVPNFEQLSPELEAALQKACTRDASTWARFCRSRPGRALTYLLLPCTLPFEYIYFRSKRLVAWLPDMPADVWWMQGVLQSLAAEIYTRSKDQLLRLVSLPVTSPLQPGAAPLVDLAKDPRPPHQA